MYSLVKLENFIEYNLKKKIEARGFLELLINYLVINILTLKNVEIKRVTFY